MKHRAIAATLAMVAVAFGSGGCGQAEVAHAKHAEAKPAVLVRLSPMEQAELARPIRAAGTLRMKEESDLSFKIGGVIERVNVDVGARVRRGQVLASIDSTEARSAVQQSREAATKAERDLQRVRSLQTAGAAVVADVQNAETAVAMTRAAAEAAEFNLKHTVIVAPAAGVIDRRMCEVGEIAAPGRPMFHMSGASRGMVVRAQLVDRDALQLRAQDRARVTLDAHPDATYAGHVSQIATQVTPGAGTIEVEVTLDALLAEGLPSGLSAKLVIESQKRSVWSVPVASLVEGDGDRAAVYVVTGERARRVPVQVLFFTDTRAAIRTELPRPEPVIEDGADRVSDGSIVRVTR